MSADTPGIFKLTDFIYAQYDVFLIRPGKDNYLFGLITEPISSDVFSGFTMAIQSNREPADKLVLAAQSGFTITFNPANGLLTCKLTSASAPRITSNQVTSLVKKVRFYTTSFSIKARVIDYSYLIGSALTIFYSINGHFYENVPAPSITWTNAMSACGARQIQGRTGYLTTLTTDEEYTFFNQIVNGQGWLGGSDSAVEGTWKWMTGPEAGQTFWQQTTNQPVAVGTCLLYCHWQAGEPNNMGSEHHLHALINGEWNDYNHNNGAIQAYFCEYGGLVSDQVKGKR